MNAEIGTSPRSFNTRNIRLEFSVQGTIDICCKIFVGQPKKIVESPVVFTDSNLITQMYVKILICSSAVTKFQVKEA
jgi:hypothetical protein